MAGDGQLVVLPAVEANSPVKDGRVVLPEKFVKGMSEYVRLWDGPVRAVIEPRDEESSELDQERYALRSLPFEVIVAGYHDAEIGQWLADADVVLGTASHHQSHIPRECQKRGVPCVWVTELSLRTRLQITRAGTPSLALRLRRYIWELQQEARLRSAIRRCAGVQCNGAPTYSAYRDLTRRALLFLDSRVSADLLVRKDALESRITQLMRGEPLRLAFSGRLVAIKGVQFLPQLAARLRELGVRFTLEIFGAGDMEPMLQGSIRELALQESVFLRGVADFSEELMPRMQRDVDLFVCTHVQGDPSCTYLETLSCGLPIVGFANEAWSGLLDRAQVGLEVPAPDTRAMADAIRDLDQDREALARLARNARAFASEWTFEVEFRARIDHLRACRDGGVGK